MFMHILLSFNTTVTIAIIAIVISVVILSYLVLLITSFIFMHNFKTDILRKKDFLNVTLYQKIDLLIKLSDLLSEYLDEKDPLKILGQNDELKAYQKLNAEEFEEFYNYSEKMLQNAQKIYINYDLKEKKKKVEEIFLAIGELNEKYFQAVQLYNTSVVAYNYWYNFFSTKWVKKLFFIVLLLKKQTKNFLTVFILFFQN